MIFNSNDEFEVLLLKDRFTEGKQTSSGWADALLNGRFLGHNTHVVEIQLHHIKLVSIREDMGGHHLYSIFRSLLEAVEVVFGDKEAQKMIAEHAPKLEVDGSMLHDGKKEDIIEKLQAEIDAKNTEIYTKNSENLQLQSENNVMKAENNKLIEEIERLKKQIPQGSSSSVVASGGTSPTSTRNDDDEVCLNNVPAALFAVSFCCLYLPSSVL